VGPKKDSAKIFQFPEIAKIFQKKENPPPPPLSGRNAQSKKKHQTSDNIVPTSINAKARTDCG